MKDLLLLLFLFGAMAGQAQSVPKVVKIIQKGSGGSGISAADRAKLDSAITKDSLRLIRNELRNKRDSVVDELPFTQGRNNDVSLLQQRHNIDSNRVYFKGKPVDAKDINGTTPFDSTFVGQLVSQNYRVNMLQAMGTGIFAETTVAQFYYNSSTTYPLNDGDARYILVYNARRDTLRSLVFDLTTAGVFTPDAAAYNGIVVYKVDNSSGVYPLVAQTANDPAIWQAPDAVKKFIPVTAPYVAEPGLYKVGFVYNATATTTIPRIQGASAASGAWQHGNDGSLPNGLRLSTTKAMASLTPPSTITWSTTSTTNERLLAGFSNKTP